MSAERAQLDISSLPQYDAVVVLGKNLGFKRTKDDIRAQHEHLAEFGRMNTDAGGILWAEGITEKLVLSTGYTVAGLESEAESMKNHAQRIWKGMRDEDIILEEVSKQTKTNAIEVRKVLEEEGLLNARLGLVTMGFHMPRAQRMFRKVGLNLDPLPSEEILGTKYPSKLSADRIRNSGLYWGERLIELRNGFVQSLPILGSWAERRVDEARS